MLLHNATITNQDECIELVYQIVSNKLKLQHNISTLSGRTLSFNKSKTVFIVIRNNFIRTTYKNSPDLSNNQKVQELNISSTSLSHNQLIDNIVSFLSEVHNLLESSFLTIF